MVDRTVAQIGSHAVQKAIRKTPGKRFVAITCHFDVIDWLQPDWIIEPHVGGFHWRSLQRRPAVEIEYVRVNHSAWRWFAPHHYMSADLNKSAKCFAALINGQPAAFAALLPFPHPHLKDTWHVTRTVALPDYQGLGLVSHQMMPWLGALCRSLGYGMLTHPAHPALMKTWAKSTDWHLLRKPTAKKTELGKSSSIGGLSKSLSRDRLNASFKYVGPALPEDQTELARRLWDAPTQSAPKASKLPKAGRKALAAPLPE